MINSFKVGVIVVCINNVGAENCVKVGKSYRVTRVENPILDNGEVCIQLDGVFHGGLFAHRFVLAEKLTTLEKIIYGVETGN